jgi:diaminopimelate decarboxylase
MMPAGQFSTGKKLSATPYGFTVRGGRLYLEGTDLASLAVKHGSPLFVFSERMVIENVKSVTGAFQARFPKSRIFYATKAGSNLSILRTIRRAGIGAEVSSEGDIFMSLVAGFSPHDLVFNGPAKSDRELAIAGRLGLYSINLDSVDELERLHAICKRDGRTARIAFRIRPDVGAGTKIIQTGTSTSKFGIGLSEAVEAYAKAASLQDHLKVVGIHAHVGSQNTSVESWRDFVMKLARLTTRLKEELGLNLQHLNVGGGVPAMHVTDSLNQPTPPFMKAVPSDDEIAGAVADALREGEIRDIEVVAEPGRRIVAGAGLLVAKIISEKTSGGQSWIYVDAGFNTLPSAPMPWYFHIVPVTKVGGREESPYRVAGPLCDNKDVFHDQHGEDEGNPTLPEHRMLPKGLHPGDYLALLDVGAYNMDIQNSFNERLMAGGVYIDRRGRPRVMRRRQEYGDLTAYEPHQKKSIDRAVRRMTHG